MSASSTLGVVIRQRRIELGWTQEELAERISSDDEYVRQSEISRIESGKVGLPRHERLVRLAEVLDLPLGELLARSGWAGADQHFQAAPSHLPVANGTDELISIAPSELPQTASDPQPAALPSAGVMSAFRQAVSTMRDESARLDHNRQLSHELLKKIQQSSDARRRGDYPDPSAT